MKKSIVILLFLLLALSVFAEKTIGVTGFIDRESPQFNLSLRPTDDIEAIGLFAMQAAEGSYTETILGFSARKYISSGKIEPYVGAHFKALILDVDNAGGTTDFITGLNGGIQYAVMENLYIGFMMEFDVNISHEKSNRFGNPDKSTYNTSVSPLYITIYW